MHALYLEAGNLQYREDYPRPERRAGHSLIKVTLAGICSTDLEIVRGYAGFQGVPGHEFVGIVQESDADSLVGRRVVGGINIGCGTCSVCIGDGPEHCPERAVLGIINHDGAFAELLTLANENLIPVPEEITDETAVFTEPLAAALRILEQARIRPTDRIAVVGPGRLGMLIGQVMRLGGSHVTMLGRRAESLALPIRLGLDSGLIGEAEDESYNDRSQCTHNVDHLSI